MVKSMCPAFISLRISGNRSYPPAWPPRAAGPACSIPCATPCVLPASTANMPATSLWPLYQASILERSSGSSAPVVTCWISMFAPESSMACFAPSILGWMLSWPGVAMNSATRPSSTISTILFPISTPDWKRSCPPHAGGASSRPRPPVPELDDPVPHLDPGLEEILPDVRGRRVVLPGLAVGVVRDHRYVLIERPLDGIVEGLRIHYRHRDPISVPRDGRVQRPPRLPHARRLRPRPLRLRPEQRLRVFDAVLRRHEEGVGGHVVDEDEVVLGRLGKVAAGPPGPALARLLRLLPAPGEQQPRRRQRAQT